MSTPIFVPYLDVIISVDGPCSFAPRLRTPITFTRYCPDCRTDLEFTADRICASGHIGRCAKGHARIVPFTRTTSEAA